MDHGDKLVALLADIRRLTRDPYPWEKVWPLAPLFFIRLGALVAYVWVLLGELPLAYTQVDFLLNAAAALCLLGLARTHNAYKYAAIPLVLSLVTTVIYYQVGQPPILMTMAGILTLGSAWLEYCAHTKLTMRQDKVLTRWWNNLFLGNMAAMLIGGFLFLMTLMLSYLFEDQAHLMFLLTLVMSYLPDFIVDVAYLYLLGRSIQLIKSQKILFDF